MDVERFDEDNKFQYPSRHGHLSSCANLIVGNVDLLNHLDLQCSHWPVLMAKQQYNVLRTRLTSCHRAFVGKLSLC